jgi:hypothetical protein
MSGLPRISEDARARSVLPTPAGPSSKIGLPKRNASHKVSDVDGSAT